MLNKQFPALRADRRREQRNSVQKDGALIYCRVSTKEQQSNLSLPGIKQRGLFEPIVEEDLFERAQAALASRGNVTRSRMNGDFPLRVFVRCEACGKGFDWKLLNQPKQKAPSVLLLPHDRLSGR